MGKLTTTKEEATERRRIEATAVRSLDYLKGNLNLPLSKKRQPNNDVTQNQWHLEDEE